MAEPRSLLDTIVALATPPGVGAVALIRLSGPRAQEIAGGLANKDEESATAWPERRCRLRSLYRPGSDDVLDRALFTLFRAPRSYTGEDLVEISTHGGVSIPASVVDACVALGAREARPGEFTQRAFLNGKLDLTQAEAVGDLVAATSPKRRAVALHQLERGLGERIAHLRSEVIGLSALLVQHIDFPEEDDAPTSIETIVSRAKHVTCEMDRLLATAPAGELLRHGAVTVLAGRPNSGKSSLFNALVGTERAIVTDEEGTTRDAIEAVVSIAGFPFRLVDTAGLRDGAGRVEQIGIEIAHRYLASADVVLYCLEAGEAPSADETAFLRSLSCPIVKVFTKWDLVPGRAAPGNGELPVSVVSGEGLSDLKEALRDLVFQGIVEGRDEVPVVTNARQADLLKQARAEVGGFGEALGRRIPPEVAAAHLKTAESALEEILGVVATDDVLDRVFRDFCIGK
ncbi:MAG: tRNA uridine-5-carboxymethylaminomethyl(34) synthesis GTPase MnmE [Gemmatimonadetes bacterium]|nr:tRNA uridine-5-carboxymethylaminomethyl(34) synthesis GTPase MnmE [Gemmatimonadota bacterium]MXX70628.1 tRNA uridine-5-carboxymethylaminomethyl(34) synthesis GTPase MnmE [Gemmatimonadota bacterium]MYC92449.1 tRNA uridine-5-carboxymethylaminomethyl(34) synthesis GTPase MnmE [Gemmatimonadota bacterium]MYG34019.1 tRNA uridine-5-carboxymethylaminomethyl(34) synthesis GTPase MnmE [Gemmatimonadota bacterium]